MGSCAQELSGSARCKSVPSLLIMLLFCVSFFISFSFLRPIFSFFLFFSSLVFTISRSLRTERSDATRKRRYEGVSNEILVQRAPYLLLEAISNKCIASSNKCLTSSNKDATRNKHLLAFSFFSLAMLFSTTKSISL